MTELDNIKKFFTENSVVKDAVSVRKIEQIAELPSNSLYRFVKGEKYRSLTEEQIKRLIPIIKQIGYIPID